MSNEQSIREELAKVAYRAWREAQRGSPIPDIELEALGSRLEERWMQEVVDACLDSPVIRRIQAEAWDEGYTRGNAHNGRRDDCPYRACAHEAGSSATRLVVTMPDPSWRIGMNDDGTVDEVVMRGAYVHFEDLGDAYMLIVENKDQHIHLTIPAQRKIRAAEGAGQPTNREGAR